MDNRRKYKCYYCDESFDVFKVTIDHLVENHPSYCIRYREIELNPENGCIGYRTKIYEHIIPEAGEVFATSDDKLGIFRGEEKLKKTKLNTPLKCGDRKILSDSSDYDIDENIQNDISKTLSEMEIGTILNEDDDDNELDGDTSELLKCIPAVLENLRECGHLHTYKKWCDLILDKQFPFDNIGFLLFLDIIDWYSSNTTSGMRYIRPQTKQFWDVGYRLFKGKFLRFMAGPRNIGNVVDGSEDRGSCQSSDSKINFAIPSVNILNETKLTPIKPGVIDETISTLATHLKSKIIKIGVDGKKISRGKGKEMGDIDCWGFEPAPALKDRVQRYEEEQAFISNLLRLVQEFDESGKSVIPSCSCYSVFDRIKNIIVLISKRIQDLRITLVRLQMGIQKFMSLGDTAAKHWSKSKYVPVISSLKVSKYDVEQAIERALCLINELGFICASFNGTEHDYCYDGKLNIQNHAKFHQLKSDIPTSDTKQVKQKSKEWFEIRSNAKVTGSTCNTALGLRRLKDQQAHFDKVIVGKDTQQFTDEQKRNMEYGNEHEIDGIATVVGRVLPSLYPNLEYYEEGCMKVSSGLHESFMVVSPDGSLKEKGSNLPVMMFENKCKVNRDYTTPVYYKIPKYYIPQLMCEMYAYECNSLLFTCWSNKSTTVFNVQFDETLWTAIWEELNVVYAVEHPKRPNKFSAKKSDLETLINEFLLNNVHFIGEFPSCAVVPAPTDILYDGGSPYTSVSSTLITEHDVSCENVLKCVRGVQIWNETVYNLCRTTATEILMFTANDLDRHFHFEINNAHPIAYALKGSSLRTEVFGQMVDYVIKQCEEKGLKVIATSSDGQWHKYGIRGIDDKPLTILQLQRDVWHAQRKRAKPEMLKELRSKCKVNVIDEVSFERGANGTIIVNGKIGDRPLKVFKNMSLKWRQPVNCTVDELSEQNESPFENASETLDVLETFGRGVNLDDALQQEIRRSDTASISANNQIPFMDVYSGFFLPELFSEYTNQINISTDQCSKVGDGDICHQDSTINSGTSTEMFAHDSSDNLRNDLEISEVMGNAFSVLHSANNSLYGIEQFDQYMPQDLVNRPCVNSPEDIEHRTYLEAGLNQDASYPTDIQADSSKTEVLKNVLVKLRGLENQRSNLWHNTTVDDFVEIIESEEKAGKSLQKKELINCIDEICRCRNVSVKYYQSWSKSRLYTTLMNCLSTNAETVIEPGRQKKRKYNPEKLQKILSRMLNKIPKDTLAMVFSENKWKTHYNEWLSKMPVLRNDILQDSHKPTWFSFPLVDENQSVRFHYDDCCHILTCLRTKICTTGITGLSRLAWENAAESNKTQLNIAIVKECVDKQSVAFAKRVFAEDVSDFMISNGFHNEAEFVTLIRRWFEAEDEPGINAKERCSRRLQLREWLLDGFIDGKFPPNSQYIKGIPIITYEALLVNIERKLQLFQFLPDARYNPRALGTQEVEQFFSTMRDLDPSGSGTPKPDDIPEVVATAAYLDNIRMNSDRSFFMRTTTAPVYLDHTMETDNSESSIDKHMMVRDHFFDTSVRCRVKKKRKSGLISTPSKPAHGQKGVRQFHACDESKILAHHRKGLGDI